MNIKSCDFHFLLSNLSAFTQAQKGAQFHFLQAFSYIVINVFAVLLMAHGVLGLKIAHPHEALCYTAEGRRGPSKIVISLF